MTKEERAEKWFCSVPDAASFSIEKKMEICNKTAKKMMVIFFSLVFVELVLLFMLSGGKIFTFTADFLNSIANGVSTKNHYKGVALIGGILCLPIIVLPLLVAFKYKNNALKAEIIKMQKESAIKKDNKLNTEIYSRIAHLITCDARIVSNLNSCFQNPKLYFERNAERYRYRVENGEDSDKVAWFAIVDELIEHNDAIELDWKEELQEFVAQLNDLAIKHNLNVDANWFNENGDIPAWCKIIDEKWTEQGFCVAAIDIDSDSYVMFVCKIGVLKELIGIGKEINHRFDFAKYM